MDVTAPVTPERAVMTIDRAAASTLSPAINIAEHPLKPNQLNHRSITPRHWNSVDWGGGAALRRGKRLVNVTPARGPRAHMPRIRVGCGAGEGEIEGAWARAGAGAGGAAGSVLTAGAAADAGATVSSAAKPAGELRERCWDWESLNRDVDAE